MFRSATARLTLYYLTIIAIISIGFSTALYQVASHDLASGLDRQNRRITNDFPIFSGSPYLRVGGDLQESREHLIRSLILCNILVIAAGGAASYFLARRTLEPIETAHERQKRFTADVSHELRTPLTTMKMESEVALMDDAADLKQVLRSNIEEADRLTDLVRNLLHLSQLDDAQTTTFSEPVTLQDSLQAAIDRIQTVAADRHITIESTIPKQKLRIAGDGAMLEQLFIILLDNAVKYSPDATAVQIKAQRQPGTISVSISDQGRGIAKADLEHIFERFYRADSARTGNQPTSGFGLGLSIAKLIADMHQATIQISSKPGSGTTATVIFSALNS